MFYSVGPTFMKNTILMTWYKGSINAADKFGVPKYFLQKIQILPHKQSKVQIPGMVNIS